MQLGYINKARFLASRMPIYYTKNNRPTKLFLKYEYDYDLSPDVIFLNLELRMSKMSDNVYFNISHIFTYVLLNFSKCIAVKQPKSLRAQ